MNDLKLKSPELTPEEWVQSEQGMDMFRNIYRSLDKNTVFKIHDPHIHFADSRNCFFNPLK